jgi:hypothetical protein
MYQPYMNPMYSPQAQRLQQMEQQYPQFTQNQIYANNAANMKCRPVSSLDEVKATMVDFDGSVSVFTDFAHGRIYTKQINLDGTATINSYAIEQPQAMTEAATVTKNEFDNTVSALQNEINNLKSILGGMQNVQSNANVRANDTATVTNQPPFPESAANGGWAQSAGTGAGSTELMPTARN